MSRRWFSSEPRLLVGGLIAACAFLAWASLALASPSGARKSIARQASVERAWKAHRCLRAKHHRRCALRRIRAQNRGGRSARRARRVSEGANSTPVSPDFYGVNGQSFNTQFLPLSRWGSNLQAIHDSGFTSVRREAWWCVVEPNPPSRGVHNYHWSELDQFVGALAQHHLRWYSTVSQGTPWAGSSWAAPPDDQHISDFAAFAAALARRYGANGTFWQENPGLPYEPVQDFEIWNEPNLTRFWVDDISQAPARYGRILAAATTAIHDADPQARTVAGALAEGGVLPATDFIARMVQANPGLRGQVSTFSFHPYGKTAERSLERIVAVRRAIDQWLGSDVRIEITEDGLSLYPGSPYTLQDRAALLSKLALTLPRTDCKITSFLPHAWTSGNDPDQPEDWYGMADSSTGQLDPSGVALKDAIQRMEGLGSTPPPSGTVHLCYG